MSNISRSKPSKRSNKPVVFKRREIRSLGVFIDGVALDRATRRLGRKIDLKRFLASLSVAGQLKLARYYTVLPYEDDSRQHAFLDAIEGAGLEPVVRRLPPIGVERQVSTEIEMTADIVKFAFASGTDDQKKEVAEESSADGLEGDQEKDTTLHKRVVLVVCPTRDMSYPLDVLRRASIDTISADFGKASDGNKEILKVVGKWIDLSESETIWRE